MFCCLKEMWIGSQSAMFNGRTIIFTSISTSMAHCFVIISNLNWNSLEVGYILGLFTVLETFAKHFPFTFWWLNAILDGLKAYKFGHGSREPKYHKHVSQLSEKYISAENLQHIFCQHVRIHLDRPNTHRILELYIYTSSISGNALIASGLEFEASHQSLNTTILRNTSCKSHMNAVDQSIGSNWLLRIYETWEILHSANSSLSALPVEM